MPNILAPIFGLIALACASRKVDIPVPSACLERNRRVARLALLADVCKRDLERTSTAIMVSTILSAPTLSLCLAIPPRILWTAAKAGGARRCQPAAMSQ